MGITQKPRKTEAARRIRYRRAPTILALLATFLAALPAQGAEARLQQVNERVVEISGGSGREAWRLRYGMLFGGEYKPLLVPAEGNRAWYAYGGWLRLIDTQKGQVLGRWHFPTVISGLKPQGTRVEVEITEKVQGWVRKGEEMDSVDHDVKRRVTLDPANPRVPFWPDSNLMRYRIPFSEVQNVLVPVNIGAGATYKKISAAEAGKVLPQLEEMVRRDPFTPWFGVALGRVLKDIDDPRSATVFQEGLNSPGADFTELLPTSYYLDDIGEHELARAAFERGYRNFWERGNDPRLVLTLIGQLTLYRPSGKESGDPSTEAGREIVEHLYRLEPYGEGAELAWRLYANYWRDKGQTDQARLWLARADDAKGRGPFNWWRSEGSGMSLNVTLLVVPAALLAIPVYWLVLFLRYRPQRQLDFAAKQRVSEPSAGFAISDVRTWTAPEQIGFLVFLVIGWGLGFWKIGPLVEGLFRAFLALYYVLPFALLFLVILYLWRRRRNPAGAREEEPNEEATRSSWLDARGWSWGRRLGLLALFLAAGTFGYFKVDTEAGSFEHLLGSFYLGIAAVLPYLLVGFLYDRARRRRIPPAQELPVRRPRGFAFLNTQYWSRAERFSFFSIVFILWLSAGLSGLYLEALLRRAASPLGAALGNFGGPGTITWLESDWLPPSPSRDLFLAFAYQQDGQGEKAERLYRTLPEFAESWNNLGAILKAQGKEAEAKQAFEHAAQLDPSMSEAILNLGRPPVDLWTELHQKYLPGQPMLAPPRENQWRQLFLGGSGYRVYLRALLGPFAVQDPAGLFGLVGKLL